MTHARALVAALAAAVSLPACLTLGCTAVAALQGLIVQVDLGGRTLPPGTYTITVVADGQKIVAQEQLASDGSITGGNPPDVIVGDKHLFLDAWLFGTAGQIEVGYREGGGPAMVSIEITSGTQLLGRELYVPQYQTAYPNGEACGADGSNASATLAISAPAQRS